MELLDFTFLYIIYSDSIERVENLLLSISYIKKHFHTHIYVLEVGAYENNILAKLLGKDIKYSFIKDTDSILYRTRYLNVMLNSTTTRFAAIIDCDIIVPHEQLKEAALKLRNDDAHVVFPFSICYDTSPIFRNLYIKTKDVLFLYNYKRFMNELYSPCPAGGIYICSLDAYKELGLENEDFYGWGFEDIERNVRWNNSRFISYRVTGPIFHLTHPRAINSKVHSLAQTAIKKRLLNKTKYTV